MPSAGSSRGPAGTVHKVGAAGAARGCCLARHLSWVRRRATQPAAGAVLGGEELGRARPQRAAALLLPAHGGGLAAYC
jgi:hypothetical protein